MASESNTTSIGRDIASAYASAAARVAGWYVVSGLVSRGAGSAAFALLALVRSTVGILNYTSPGLAPAMSALRGGSRGDASDGSRVYSQALLLAVVSCAVGFAAVAAYAHFFGVIHTALPHPAAQVEWVVGFVGAGLVLRLMSDPSGAALQLEGRIARDNALTGAAEVLWPAMAWALVRSGVEPLRAAAVAFALSSLVLLIGRWMAAGQVTGVWTPSRNPDGALLKALLASGLLITAAQAADYLYAPMDYVLIGRLLGPADLEAYAPAVAMDGALLLLVSGLANVLLPHTALAHAAENRALVRKYYVRGTLAGLIMLAAAALATWAMAPLLLRLWLGREIPGTLAILPWVLIHTVAGGASAVGRSVLLAMGRVRALTISVLAAGACNVVVSYACVKAGMGLRGIVVGTIVAVVARCVVWMPWYVLRGLRASER